MSKRFVFITGAASGIGLASAERLHAVGFHIIAGVYPGEDAAGLDALKGDRLHTVNIDVTKSDSIMAARQQIEAITGGQLYGLFNNAGIAIPGVMEFIPIDLLRHQLEVNLFGQVQVTQALLSMIRQAQGRIVNTISILGRVTTAYSGPYCISKHAMESFTDALRVELEPHGVTVCAIEPGSIRTAIWQKTKANHEEMVAELPPEGQQLYGAPLEKLGVLIERVEDEGIPPEHVAKAVEQAFTAKRPKTRYVVGADAKLIAFLRRILPDRTIDSILERRYPTRS